MLPNRAAPFDGEVHSDQAFVVGLLVGVLLLIGGVYFYFASGMAPVATSDEPMPYEKKMASLSKNAHIRASRTHIPTIAPFF
jgi:hypothetical protein